MSGQVQKIQRFPRVIGLNDRPKTAAAYDLQSGEFPDTVTLINPHFDIAMGRASLSRSDFSDHTSALIESLSMFGPQLVLDVIVSDFLAETAHGERWVVTVGDEINDQEAKLVSIEGQN